MNNVNSPLVAFASALVGFRLRAGVAPSAPRIGCNLRRRPSAALAWVSASLNGPRFLRRWLNPRLLAAGSLACAVLFAAGCTSRPTAAAPRAIDAATFDPEPATAAAPIDPALLNPPPTPVTLGPGDQLDLELLDDPASRTTATVGPDGKIYFYLVPGVDVWGLTLDQARQKLEQGMEQYFRERRPVSVSLRNSQSQRLWILGRVNRPGVYPVAGTVSLLEALALADGPASSSPTAALSSALGGVDIGQAVDDSANLRRAFVLRDGQRLPVDLDRLLNQGDLSQNIRLRGGDFIFLPSSAGNDISVLGAVATARNVPYRRDMTVVTAIAGAGGTVTDAFVRQVAIVRGSLNQPRVAIVDYQGIVTGQVPDVRLEPQDIVYVPHQPYRTLKRYVNLILDTFVRATGVNEGARAIDPNIQPPGISVPVTLTQ
jgi:protein involved in polysaccharide export with SLBB domain